MEESKRPASNVGRPVRPPPKRSRKEENIALGKSEESTLLLSSREHEPENISNRGSSVGFGESFRKFRSATMTMSLLEKPSDDRRASAFLAGWNVTNLIQGTGILGVPYAVRMGGWASVATIVLVALVCCYTGKLLVECLYEESKRTGARKRVRINYPEVGEAVWPGWGNRVVSVIQVCEMFGGLVMYIVLLATVFNDILAGQTSLGIYKWSVVCAFAALPMAFVSRMSVIAWFSMISVFALLSNIATIIIFCITEYSDMSLSNIPAFNPESFPIGFGVIVFSYTAHAVFPGIEGSMREPNQYPMMMNIAFLLSAIVKVLLGLLAVLRFGENTEQSITVNMNISPVFSMITTVLVVTNVYLAFPLNLFVVLETWDTKLSPYFPHLKKESKHHWFWLILTRTMIMTCGLFVAIVVPHFALVMGLVGSFTGTCLSFVFPCIFHIKLKWKMLQWYNILLKIVIAVFGVVSGGFGVVFTAKELARVFTGF